MVRIIRDPRTKESMVHAINAADAIALAIIEDEIIFNFVPRTQRMVHETVLAVISETPETIEATGKMAAGIGTGVERSGKGIRQATGGVVKDVMPSVLSLIGITG